jgi:hypothetical protein
VKPTTHRGALADGARIAHESEEGSLECVFDIVLMVQHTLADAPHHGPVPPDEDLKRCLIALADEALEQVGVDEAARRSCADEPVQMPDHTA